MEYTFIQYLWFFVIYSFIGWSVEVSFHTLTSGEFINRGFLNGPVCPIYGFGMTILLFVLGPLMHSNILLFIGSFCLTSLLEFVTGFVLEKVFHKKWWDYSKKPFNIKGYVCLSFSILWGLAAVFVLNIVHPTISNLISIKDNLIGNIVLIILIAYFIADFIVTVLGIMKINKRFRILTQMAEELKMQSDDMGENIHETMTNIIISRQALHSKLEDRRSDKSKLERKYKRLLNRKPFVHRRLERAFPNIKEKISDLEKHRKSR